MGKKENDIGKVDLPNFLKLVAPVKSSGKPSTVPDNRIKKGKESKRKKPP